MKKDDEKRSVIKMRKNDDKRSVTKVVGCISLQRGIEQQQANMAC